MTTEIKKFTFKAGLPQEFEIIEISQLYKRLRDELTSYHRTGFYHILWFQKGTPTHLVDFIPVKIKPNTILFLNKDSVHRFDDKARFEAKAIIFTDSFYCQTAADTKFLKSTIMFNDLLSISQIQLHKSNFIFAELFQQMEKELTNSKDNYQSDILRNFLRSLLLQAERERRKQGFTEVKKGTDLDIVVLFRDLLEMNFQDQRLVSNYAKEMHLTGKRLNRATSNVLGKTPKQLIHDRIMLEAKRLLAHSRESVKEIGFELGFDEPTNFIKYFRKHHNSTPLEFRESFTP